MLRIFALVLVSVAVLMPLQAHAQDASSTPPLITDRPDFTESAVVVPLDAVQVEGGFTYSDHAFGMVSIGELLVRYGLLDRLELRAVLPSYASVDNAAGTDGFTDSQVGFKYQLGPTRNGWDVGVLGALSLPTGADAFSSGTIDPSAIFVAGRSVNDRVSVAGQVRGLIEGKNNDAILESSIVGAMSLATDMTGFAELAARFQDGVDTGVQLHTGVTSLIRPGFQLDIHAGVGLSNTAPDWFLGAGFSYRR